RTCAVCRPVFKALRLPGCPPGLRFDSIGLVVFRFWHAPSPSGAVAAGSDVISWSMRRILPQVWRCSIAIAFFQGNAGEKCSIAFGCFCAEGDVFSNLEFDTPMTESPFDWIETIASYPKTYLPSLDRRK